jgi:hypothetical protein
MRVLLRNVERETYYAGSGHWVSDTELAHDFRHPELAERCYLDELAKQAGTFEIVFIKGQAIMGGVKLPVSSGDAKWPIDFKGLSSTQKKSS